MKSLTICLVGACLCQLVMSIVPFRISNSRFAELTQAEWDAFKSMHEKSYENPIIETYRMKVYVWNRLRIAQHNKDKNATFKMGINQFSDLLPHEFTKIMNGYRPEDQGNANLSGQKGVTFLTPKHFTAPDQVDWRNEGYVTPVKNQGQCGACWSFSTTGALEGQNMRKNGMLVSLSEQNLVDCSTSDHGCNGGFMTTAYKYVMRTGGIDTEYSYPYEADEGPCRFDRSNVGSSCTGYVEINQGDEEDLMNAVASVGPVAVAIDVQPSFQLYRYGIYQDDSCSSTQLNHAVLVVGYGSDPESGLDYWLVKNSWGTEWGDNGYIKMARNSNNMCGIATAASYPTV